MIKFHCLFEAISPVCFEAPMLLHFPTKCVREFICATLFHILEVCKVMQHEMKSIAHVLGVNFFGGDCFTSLSIRQRGKVTNPL